MSITTEEQNEGHSINPDRLPRYMWDNPEDFDVELGSGEVLLDFDKPAHEAEDAEKQTHEAVRYEQPARGMDHCNDCTHYIREGSVMHCQLVVDPIAPNGWCKLFKEKQKAQDENPDIERRVTLPYGLIVYIENEEGSERRGPWGAVIMRNPYGYIAKTKGVDGDCVDCFLGPDYETEQVVYIIHQEGPDPEDKLMIGFHSAKNAANAYEQNYHPKPPEYSMEKIQLHELPQKLEKFRGRRIKA